MNSLFPVLQSGKKIYVDATCLSSERAQINHGQSLRKIASRGGLSPKEIVLNVEGRPLKDIHFVTDRYADLVVKRIGVISE